MRGIFYVIIFLTIVAVGALAVFKESRAPEKTLSMNVSSKEFENGAAIPSKFTCQGENINPELKIQEVPAGAKSLVLIMDDPDIPDSVKQARGIEIFDHWVAFNIPPATTEIKEGTEPEGVSGLNSAGANGYRGPCPPDGEHRYFFKLYALDTMLDLGSGASRQDVEKAIAGHILAQAELLGTYVKK